MPTEQSQPAAGQELSAQIADAPCLSQAKPLSSRASSTSTKRSVGKTTQSPSTMGWADLLYAQEPCFVLGYN